MKTEIIINPVDVYLAEQERKAQLALDANNLANQRGNRKARRDIQFKRVKVKK